MELAGAAKKLKIPFKYLEALEYGDFSNLPDERFWKPMLKKYCRLLDLDFSEMYLLAKNESRKALPLQHRMRRSYLRAWPRVIRTGLILLVVAGVLVFLGIKVNQIFSPPPLEIIQPQDGSIIREQTIKVIGKSRKEAEITINNNPIFVDADGRFETQIDLKKGLNLIKITAKKKYSRIQETDLRVLLSDPDSKD